MSYQHKELAAGRWAQLTFSEQMANIGSEVIRAIKWKNKNNAKLSQNAFDRALELLYLTIENKKNKSRLRELTRLHEVLVDYFNCDNIYKSSDKLWQQYFLAFNYKARLEKGV